jgi:murein DD-endopeptidase MepM/ murein hydrolase activator NlpD
MSIAYDTVRSASDGTVWFVGYNPSDPTGGYEPTGCGNYIFVQTTWGGVQLYPLYCHLSRPLVAAGQQVVKGTPLAISGNTGNSTGPHLHFELRLGTASASTSRNRRNPELWVAISGMGAIYGRVPGAANNTRVDISPDPKPRPPYTSFSYALTYNFADPAIGSDDIYGENYAIGDVKPGSYTITALSGAYRRQVVVRAGEVVNADAGVAFAEAEEQLPETNALAQNYPNPFNPTTVIKYTIAGVRNVKLAIYDLLGREVAILVDEPKGPGTYWVTFDGTGLSTGTYFYRLYVDNEVQTRRMVLMK